MEMDVRAILSNLINDETIKTSNRSEIGGVIWTERFVETKITLDKAMEIKTQISSDTREIGQAKEMKIGTDNRMKIIITDNQISRLTIMVEIGIRIEIIRDHRITGIIKDLGMEMETKTDGTIRMEVEIKEIISDNTQTTTDKTGMEIRTRIRDEMLVKADGLAKIITTINGIQTEFQTKTEIRKITNKVGLARIPDIIETTKTDRK